ncbi:MAG: ComF family protein [Sphingomicrobium sp.]|nr:ComF family protein [Sphingomonadales bacterium]
MVSTLTAEGIGRAVWSGAHWLLDLVLPPRCPGCGEIVGTLHSFCPPCWSALEFLGERGCLTCGIPLEATDSGTCAACLARPPRIARTRAAVAYGDISRKLAIRLKYGRKVAVAKAMARYMAPLVGTTGDALLVPVPLHRRRLAVRGFNQSLLIAHEIGRSRDLNVIPRALRRKRATPPLKGMSFSQRRRTVAGAFVVHKGIDIAGRTVILVDDVLTTGSTANACARALQRAGVARVELICWARVVRPPQFER